MSKSDCFQVCVHVIEENNVSWALEEKEKKWFYAKSNWQKGMCN